MISKVTSRSIMLNIFNGFSCRSIDAISICVLQAVSRARHSALDLLRRTEYRENIQTEQKTLQNQTNS